MTGNLNKVCISYKTHTTIENYKHLYFIIYFNNDKQYYNINTYIKTWKNSDI